MRTVVHYPLINALKGYCAENPFHSLFWLTVAKSSSLMLSSLLTAALRRIPLALKLGDSRGRWVTRGVDMSGGHTEASKRT